MGDTRKIQNSLVKETENNITKDKILTPENSYSIWSDTALATRLNYSGIIISVIDEVLNFTSEHSSVLENFLTVTVPTRIMGLYYLLPSLLPFVPSIFSYFKKKDKPFNSPIDVEREDLINYLMDDDEVRQQLEENPGIHKKLLNKVIQYYNQADSNRITLIINLVYFSLHFAQGVILIANVGSADTKKEIFRWIDFLSSVINISYLFARGIQKIHHPKSQKSSITNTSQTFYPRKKTSSISVDDSSFHQLLLPSTV